MKSNENVSDIPKNCPKCGMKLRLVTGDFGKFLGCTGYSQFLEEKITILIFV